MAVNVNTVYQTVLYLLNKEQRGYVTPAEFNSVADMVQKKYLILIFLMATKSIDKTKITQIMILNF